MDVVNLSTLLKILDKIGTTCIIAELVTILSILFVGELITYSLVEAITHLFVKTIFIVIILIGVRICYKHAKHFIQWRLVSYAIVSMALIMLISMLKYSYQYPYIISFMVLFTYRLCFIIAQLLFLVGLWSFIFTYMGTRKAREGIVFKEAIIVFTIFTLGIMIFFTVNMLVIQHGLRQDIIDKLATIVYAAGVIQSIIFIHRFLYLTKASLIRIYSALALLISTMFLTIDYVYALKYLFEETGMHELIDLTLTILGFIIAIVSILLLSGLDLITRIIFKQVRLLKTPTTQSSREFRQPQIFLIEYYREDPSLSLDAIRLTINTFIKIYSDIEHVFIVSYQGSPFYEYLLEISRSNKLDTTTVFIVKGVGLPRFDKKLGAYVSVFDGNHLKIIYDDRAKNKKTLIIFDNFTHYIMLYGVERVYSTINVFLSRMKQRDIVIMLFNPEAHTSKEKAYVRSLTRNILSIGF